MSRQCEKCHGRLIILDESLERYDLVCSRCGARQVLDYGIDNPPPCTC